MKSRAALVSFLALAFLPAALACNKGEQGRRSSAEASASPPAAAGEAAAPAQAQAGAEGTAGAELPPAGDISLPRSNLVTYVATNYAFDGPRSIPAGLTTFRLVNRGQELHHMILVKLEGGKSAADLVQAMKAAVPEGAFPSWAVFEGGPVGTAPGAESNATFVLAPGSYAFICVVPSPDGVAHMAKGMMEAVEVVAREGTAESPEPQADLTVKLVDFDFQLSEALSTGRHVVRVENAGPQVHEIVIWQLPPGRSLADLISWVEGGLSGPPPGKPVAGLSPMGAGGHGYFVMALPPGEYAMICFVPDDKDGKPHFAHAMARQISVS